MVIGLSRGLSEISLVDVSQRLAVARQAKDWSQTDLARKAKVHEVSIARWETGKRKISVEGAIKVGTVLGVNPYWLRGDSDDREIQPPAVPISDRPAWAVELAEALGRLQSDVTVLLERTAQLSTGQAPSTPTPADVAQIAGGAAGTVGAQRAKKRAAAKAVIP